MNKVVLVGRLTKDPELKFTPGNSTAVATVTLAVDRRVKQEGKQSADFIPVVIWGKQAEATANYMTKGSQLSVSGRIEVRTYDAKDGTKRYVTEVVAEEVQFLDKKGTASNATETKNSSKAEGYDDVDMTPVDDGDIPF